jgi:hypothetical protein
MNNDTSSIGDVLYWDKTTPAQGIRQENDSPAEGPVLLPIFTGRSLERF